MVASTNATSGSALNLPGMETFAVLDAITFTDNANNIQKVILVRDPSGYRYYTGKWQGLTDPNN
jgi:hypothetical protein